MQNHRGQGKQPNGSRRGQAPSNRGRGQGQTSKFADTSQPAIMEYQDTDDFLVLNFNDMAVLSGAPNGAAHSPRGRGARGAHHFIPGPNLRRPYVPPYRARGRGGRGGYIPMSVVMGPPPFTPPRSNANQGGHPFFRGRGGGLGFVVSPERPGPKNWELSSRPLLKPIKFVRAEERLFEADPEELLQAHKMPPLPTDQLDPQTEALAEAFEDAGESTSVMPTGNNSGQETPLSVMEFTIKETSLKETTVTTDSIEQTITTQYTATQTRPTAAQEDLLAILLDAAGATGADSDSKSMSREEISVQSPPQKTSDLFWIDTSGHRDKKPSILSQTPIYESRNGPIVGEGDMDEPDEIILVPTPAVRRAMSMGNLRSLGAPVIPRKPAAAAPPAVTMETLSLSFTKNDGDTSKQNKSLKSFSIPKSGRSSFVPPRARKETQRRKRDEAWTNGLGSVFGFKDGREGLRKGDSDMEISSDSAEDEAEDNGMTIDGDHDAAAMANFARQVNQPHMSMDDVVIEAALRAGDLDSSEDEDDDDDDDVAMELGVDIVFEKGEGDEDDDDDDDEDWSSDDDDVDMTPTTSFKSRLKRVRERTPADVDSDEVERVINDAELSWADRDEDFIAEIEDILDENAELLGSRGKKDRKARNELFRAIRDGDADHPFAAMSSRYKNGKDAIDQLAEQWTKDRNKKAERKRQREQERMAQGGLGNGKTKGKNRSVDLEEVEQMMRDLISSTDPGAKKSFQLPLMDKATRVKVHAMAQALHLKSTSDGKKKNSEHKTMMISRGKNSGMRAVNEGKMDSLMKRKRGTGKHDGGHIREGDVIGHKAARIDEGNIGYRLLAQMGWSEGDKIGREGGLEVPIVAIMKKSKLGLGASLA